MKDKKKNIFLMILFIFLIFGLTQIGPAAYSTSNSNILKVETNPYFNNNDVNDMLDMFDKQFKDFFNESKDFQRKFYQHNPFNKSGFESVKTEETTDEYKIILDLKKFGNDEKNINFELKNNIVTISAKYENREEGNNYYNSSSFYKSFRLPNKVDAKNVKKIFKNNKLIFIIPKLENSQRPLPNKKAPVNQIPNFKFNEYDGNFI